MSKDRLKNNKKDNKYLVLNLDDEINIELFNEIYYKFTTGERVLIKDIAIDLVNAILKAKE